MKTKEITKQTLINELIEKNPETISVLMGYGLHCIGCHFSEFDTLENGAMMHGMSEEEIDLMIKDVNKTISAVKNKRVSKKKVNSKKLKVGFKR